MARIRTIKPDFFRHERLFDAERDTGLPLRLAFAGLWTAADREGRFKWHPRQLKLDCLPYDDADFSRVLDALSTRGFIIKYTVAGEEYGHIPSWRQHQVINNREKPSDIPEPTENNSISTRAPRVADACPTPLSNSQGEGEGKGREKKDAASPPSAPEKDLFDRGKQVLGKEAGGLIAKLLASKGRNIADARAVIETASNKQNPREYVGAVVRGQHATDADQFKKIEEVMRRKGSAVVFDSEVEGGIPGIP